MLQQYIIEFERVTVEKGQACIKFNSLREAEEWAEANNNYEDVWWDDSALSPNVRQRVTNVRLSARY